MSGRKLLLDSYIVIYLAKQQVQPESLIKPDDALFISDITLMETLGYPFFDPMEKLETERLLSILIRVPISDEIVQKVISIRQSQRVKLPDAIIAASALVDDLTLVTSNVSDFAGMSDLAVVNPFE